MYNCISNSDFTLKSLYLIHHQLLLHGSTEGDDSDGIGGITSDACSALTSANAASMNGKIALIERGDCSFISKVKVAQDAGAKAVIVINRNDGSNADNLEGIASAASSELVILQFLL